MARPLLLDTCAAIWIASGDEISKPAMSALNLAHADGTPIYVSPITAWEIGMLTSRGRINLLMPPDLWFARLLQAPGVRVAEMPPELLIAASFLPGIAPRDPADRIIAATARQYGQVLMTRDRPLLDYAGHGHVSALAC
ncbi:MAG: type II toxin-antitoxin system VapC family toxin [Xanthobacteraceae bacterium]